MASVFQAYLVVFLIFLVVGTSIQKDLLKRLDKHSTKRANGLLADVVNLLVEEKREREIVLEENKAMKQTMEKIKKRLDTVVTDVTKKSSRQFKDMQGQLDITKQSLAALTNKSSTHFSSMQNQLDTTRQSVTSHINESSIRYHGIQTQLSAIKTKSGDGLVNKQRMIGFTARFSSDGNREGVLKFDNVVLNYGNRYDETTGKFTCSKPGLYIFNLYILSTTKGAHATLNKNHSFLAQAHASYDDDNGAWNSGSVGVVEKLDIGDVVWVVGSQAYYNGVSFWSGALI